MGSSWRFVWNRSRRFGEKVAITQARIGGRVWEKCEIGAWLKVTDPAPEKPATRNPFYKSFVTSKNDALSSLNDKNSIYQDTSIETLQSRGVQFISCQFGFGSIPSSPP
jgi:hypothetical protein